MGSINIISDEQLIGINVLQKGDGMVNILLKKDGNLTS